MAWVEHRHSMNTKYKDVPNLFLNITFMYKSDLYRYVWKSVCGKHFFPYYIKYDDKITIFPNLK